MTETDANVVVEDSLILEPGSTATFTGVAVTGVSSGPNISSPVVTFGANVSTFVYLIVNGNPQTAATNVVGSTVFWYAPAALTITKMVYSVTTASGTTTLFLQKNGVPNNEISLAASSAVSTLSPAITMNAGDNLIVYVNNTVIGTIYVSLYIQ
jgi:hypothetical protein